MHFPCTNPVCSRPLDQNSETTGLCFDCRGALSRKMVPTCGFIPIHALSTLGRDLHHTLSPTPQDATAALRLLRGSRHPVGAWEDRPVYSNPVLHSYSPRVPLKRRMPELLVGRRHPPTINNLLASYSHFVLARHVLGLPPLPCYFLAGATFYRRKDTTRPVGNRIEYRGRIVRNSYRLTFAEFTSLGRLVIKAAGLLGVHRGLDAEITAEYLQGVEAGQFYPPVIVPANAQRTLASGDHPLDHKINQRTYHAKMYWGCTRRASGLMHSTGEWPALLNRSHHEVQRDLTADRDAKAAIFKIKTTGETPDTDWLFD